MKMFQGGGGGAHGKAGNGDEIIPLNPTQQQQHSPPNNDYHPNKDVNDDDEHHYDYLTSAAGNHQYEEYHHTHNHHQQHHNHPSSLRSSAVPAMHHFDVEDSISCFFYRASCRVRWSIERCIRSQAFCEETIQRPFCYGAIDGMLTGASIASACAGMGLFDPYTNPRQRLIVVSLVLAACTADALCMAIGHVWSARVLHEAAVQERDDEYQSFRKRRGESKAKLVDMLLMRGMLKIDAMSIADTLEGYPDIFVSALVGDGHLNGPLGLAGGSVGGSGNGVAGGAWGVASNNSLGWSHGDVAGMEGELFGRGIVSGSGSYDGDVDVMMGEMMDSAFVGRGGEHDDDSVGVGTGRGTAANSLLSESTQEGLVMMISFTLFSVIPPLIHGFIPAWVNPPPSPRPISAGGEELNSEEIAAAQQSTGISSTSVTVTITAIVMLLLGVWKSKFSPSSSWIFYGLETVLVLLLCLFTAYLLGKLLASMIGLPHNGGRGVGNIIHYEDYH